MYVTKLWADGAWNWDIAQQPYMTLMYGGVVPIIMTPLIKVFGFSLTLGRMVMVVSTLLIAVFSYLIVRRATGKWWAGALAGLLLFTSPTIRDWSLQARPDMLATLFSVAGLYLAIKYYHTRWFYISILVFVIAIHTKTSAVSGLGAVGLYLLIYDRRMLLKYGGLMLALVVATFGIANIATNGGYLQHLTTYNQTYPFTWQWDVILGNMGTVLVPLWGLLLFAMTYTLLAFRGEKRYDIVALYFIVATTIGLLVSVREGSFINYMVEFIIATTICACMLFPHLVRWLKVPEKRGITYSYLAFLLVIMAVFCTPHAFPFPDAEYDKNVEYITNYINGSDKPVLTENAGLVLNAGKVPYIEPFVFTNLQQLGYWDEAPYIKAIEDQQFDYIVLRSPATYPPRTGTGHFTLGVMDAIADNYVIVYEPEGGYYWYGLCLYEKKGVK